MLRALASFALVLACGCGNHFVEPHPPQLERAQATYTAGSAGEPTSYLVVLDLYLERSAGCADQHAFALQTIRAAMGPEAIEIAVEDASPTCAQLSTRSIDPLAVDTAIVAAQAAHAAAHLRPILVYVNNIDLPITHPLIDQLAAIRSRSVARVQQAPLYWALAAAKPAGDLRSDRIVPWTFTGDAALGATLRSLASADLPLQSETGDVAGPLPLLGEDALHRALQFKLCSGSDFVAPLGFAGDGSAQPVDPQKPPAFSVALPPRYAIPLSEFKPRAITLPVELCLLHCDRFFGYLPGDDPVVWDQVAGCLLPQSQP